MTTPPRPPLYRRIGSLWYFVVPIVSLGLFSVLPFVHAAARLRRRSTWLLVAIYGTLNAVTFAWSTIQGSKPEAPTTPADALVVVTTLAVMVAALVQLRTLRREVFGLGDDHPHPHPGHGPTPPPQDPVDPAVAAVLAARARRDQARALAAKDPLMARELHIGRPDLPTRYDDGGLVDLASAPASAIAAVCGLTAEDADRVVAARGTFTNVDELLINTDIPVDAWDRVRDRAVVIRA